LFLTCIIILPSHAYIGLRSCLISWGLLFNVTLIFLSVTCVPCFFCYKNLANLVDWYIIRLNNTYLIHFALATIIIFGKECKLLWVSSLYMLHSKIENAQWAEKTTTMRSGIRETATTRTF
jgi:hypothetical protein